jgi:oligogalacturonide transport system permease protein
VVQAVITRQMTKKHRQWLFGYLFIGLWILGFVVFTLVPVGQSLYYSLTSYKVTSEGLEGSFIGFKNYIDIIIKDVYYIEALFNYFSNLTVMLVAIIVFAVMIAMLLNRKFHLRGFWRTIYFLPVIISSGPVLKKLTENGALAIAGDEGSGLLSILTNAIPLILSETIGTVFEKIVIILWFTGVPVLLFLAGLQKINPHLYEAAKVDGASGWEIFWKIILPDLKPLININIIFIVVSLSLFSSNEIMYLIDQKKLVQFGYSNAMTWLYFLITAIFLGLYLLILNGSSFKRKNKSIIRMKNDRVEIRKEAS